MNIDSLYTGEKTALYNCVLSVKLSDVSKISEYISTEEFKNYARIDVSDNDSTIDLLLKAACEKLQTYANLSFVKRSVQATMQTPNGYYPLPYGPLLSDPSATDTEGNVIEFTSNEQGIRVNTNCAYIVNYNAGHEVDQGLPADIKLAIMDQALFFYDNRAIGDITNTVKALLKPYMFK